MGAGFDALDFQSLHQCFADYFPCFLLENCLSICLFFNLSKIAAEDEKTETALESVLCMSCFLACPDVLAWILDETEEGTKTIANIRCAATRASWSGWIIVNSNWWNKASGNTWQQIYKVSSKEDKDKCGLWFI
jgi:hypothetical protein